MNFIPLQKYLVIQKINDDNNLLQRQSQYEKAKVLKVSKEISIIKEGDIIFIPLYAGNVYMEDDNCFFIVTLDEVIGKFIKQ